MAFDVTTPSRPMTLISFPEGRVTVQALDHQGGVQLGGALRLAVLKETGLAFGVQWQPGDHGLRFSIGFAFSSAQPPPTKRFVDEEVVAPVAKVVEVAKPGARVFRDPLPRLRLKIKPERMNGDDANRHLQYGPQSGGASEAPPSAPAPAAQPPEAKPPVERR